MEKQAENMTKRAKLMLPDAKLYDSVLLEVPPFDRGPADHRNILCLITKIDSNKQYTLATKHGILKGTYSRNYFELCKNPNLLTLDKINDKIEITLRQASTAESLVGGQGMVKCNCTSQCKTKLCSCLKAGLLCNSRCHNSRTCCNK
jgi:hypothetical protein